MGKGIKHANIRSIKGLMKILFQKRKGVQSKERKKILRPQIYKNYLNLQNN